MQGNNGLVGSIPAALCSLDALTRLDLSLNALRGTVRARVCICRVGPASSALLRDLLDAPDGDCV